MWVHTAHIECLGMNSVSASATYLYVSNRDSGGKTRHPLWNYFGLSGDMTVKCINLAGGSGPLPTVISNFVLDVPSRELTYPPDKAYLKMIFPFPRWDMLVSWRVLVTTWESSPMHSFSQSNGKKRSRS